MAGITIKDRITKFYQITANLNHESFYVLKISMISIIRHTFDSWSSLHSKSLSWFERVCFSFSKFFTKWTVTCKISEKIFNPMYCLHMNKNISNLKPTMNLHEINMYRIKYEAIPLIKLLYSGPTMF